MPRFHGIRHAIVAASAAAIALSIPGAGSALAASAVPAPSGPCPQLPASVDPTTLSRSQLAAYGLPDTTGLSRSQRDALLRGARHRVCTATRTTRIRRPVPAPGVHSATGLTNGTNFSYNWSGYYANGGTGYNAVFGHWTEPCLGGEDVYPDYSSVWVGLGGVNLANNNLVQTGTVQRDPGGGSSQTHEAWVENVADPTNPYERDVFPVSCGDVLDAEVYGTNTMFIEDLTSGKYASQSFGPAPDTTSAEWIVERPETLFGLANLADFQTVTMQYGLARPVGSTNWSYINVLPNTQDIMVGDDGVTQLDSISSLSTFGTFTATWENNNSGVG